MSLPDYDDSEFDELPFQQEEIEPPTIVQELTERKCYRHRWVTKYVAKYMADADVWVPDRDLPSRVECDRCGKVQDEARTRMGKSSRRLGSDQERRAERVYGWEKIGERGQMTDLRGELFKVQQKASRRPAPALFRAVFPALDASRDQRIPLILLSFVKAGVGTDDYIVIRGRDWLDWVGRDGSDSLVRGDKRLGE